MHASNERNVLNTWLPINNTVSAFQLATEVTVTVLERITDFWFLDFFEFLKCCCGMGVPILKLKATSISLFDVWSSSLSSYQSFIQNNTNTFFVERQRTGPQLSEDLRASHTFKRLIRFLNMSLVNIIQVTVLDNPTAFTNPFQFEITFECLQELQDGNVLALLSYRKKFVCPLCAPN